MDDFRTAAWRAYAKVNLALAVGPPIPREPPTAFSGYHPIASWMAGVELFDDVHVTRVAPGGVGGGAGSTYAAEWASDAPRASPIDWPLEKDLAVRAHRLLEAEVGSALPVALRVVKRIPVGGGLGGGSADAAAALMGIRELFELPIDMGRLAELSSKLGSDVAFFLDGAGPPRGAIVSGLGEKIERLAGGVVRQGIVLFFPPFGCPTGAVYRAFDDERAGEGFEIRAAEVRRLAASALREGRIATDELFNDLAAPACRVEPALRDVIDRLAGELNVHIHVTGSGSTLFALLGADEDARDMARRAAEAVPGVTAVATRVV